MNSIVRFLKKRWGLTITMGLVLGYLLTPVSVPDYPTSTVLNDQENNLLNASISTDGQWRFPLTDSVPEKLEKCLLLYEDEYFYQHPGINPIAVLRATYQNLSAGSVVSGASTLTMQLARMIRKEERTIWQKLIEMGMALRLELYHSKSEILRYYASFAPFGGNVVGIDAASWRYYGRPAHLLSWAESASLAVLPNQPGVIYPGTGTSELKNKRDFLLGKLLNKGVIDTLEYQLSLEEPLPNKPYPVPQKAPHLMTTLSNQKNGEHVQTTIDPFWQAKATEILERKHEILKTNGVDNAAVIAVDLSNGKVLAYVGNTQDVTIDGFHVDIIQSRRSSGSILKPFLYAAALDNGNILPETLLPDIPTFFGGYTPKNFNLGYEGMVSARKALSMSLNIPFIHLLQDYKYEQFHYDLKNFGITTLDQPPGHYGLSIILGGAEVKLWDLAQSYFSLYRRLANEDNYQISVTDSPKKINDLPLQEINIWHTFQAMTELKRTGIDQNWENFSSTQKIAWKTGTSFGFRDAWAIGLNGNILVGVWAGNADGEGRAGLSGASSAGPMLTELIRLSDYNPNWLSDLKPYAEVRKTCSISGMLAGSACESTTDIPLSSRGEVSGFCLYHEAVWMDESATYLVNRSCYPADKAQKKSLFLLPPTMGNYYRKNHSDYQGKPPVYPGCKPETENNQIAITYPTANAKVFIPRELSGSSGEVIIEASHQSQSAELFWHINERYIGSTTGEHKQSLLLSKGKYLVTLLDRKGNSTSQSFEVVSGDKELEKD